MLATRIRRGVQAVLLAIREPLGLAEVVFPSLCRVFLGTRSGDNSIGPFFFFSNINYACRYDAHSIGDRSTNHASFEV